MSSLDAAYHDLLPHDLPHGEEAWREIPGFRDYQASTAGRIRSRKSGMWRILRPTLHSKTGYLVVSPRVNRKYMARSVHRLIALTFLGPPNGKDVNHKNGNKQDNRLCNLEYLSRGDNHRHAYRTGLREPVGKKLTDEHVRLIFSLSGVVRQKELAHRFGVSRATVGRIHNRQRHEALLS